MHVIINYSCTIVHNVSYRQISFKDIAKNPKKSAFWKDYEYNKGFFNSLPDITWPLNDPVIVRDSMLCTTDVIDTLIFV